MTREVVWSPRALRDFANQIGFVARQDERNATLVADRLERAAYALGVRSTGRPSRMAGMFEKSVSRTPLIIAYDLTDKTVKIVRIIHSSQDWTKDSWPKDGG